VFLVLNDVSDVKAASSTGMYRIYEKCISTSRLSVLLRPNIGVVRRRVKPLMRVRRITKRLGHKRFVTNRRWFTS
jgi:hypothetical protein